MTPTSPITPNEPLVGKLRVESTIDPDTAESSDPFENIRPVTRE